MRIELFPLQSGNLCVSSLFRFTTILIPTPLPLPLTDELRRQTTHEAFFLGKCSPPHERVQVCAQAMAMAMAMDCILFLVAS